MERKMDFEVTGILPSDIDEITELFIEAYKQEPWNESWESRDVVTGYIRKWASNNFFIGFAAKCGGKVVAVSLGSEKPYAKGAEYYINDYFVDPDLQRQGVGTALMKGIKNELENIGIPAIMLSTQRGIPAHAFYEKLEFFTLEDAIVMVGDV
jgi:GNAT superfamily N-acetyltransferase